MKTWYCKIGEVETLPAGADNSMRKAVEQGYEAVAGGAPDFIFSGWGAELTESERAAYEDREPDPVRIAQDLRAALASVDRHIEGAITLQDRVQTIRDYFQGGEELPDWIPEQWIATAMTKLGDAAKALHAESPPLAKEHGIECLLAVAACCMDAVVALEGQGGN